VTGTIYLVFPLRLVEFSRRTGFCTSTDRTMVTINDQLVVDGKFAKSVTILNVPNGDHVIHYTADNSFYKTPLKAEFPIKMENGKSMTKLVEVPPYNTGYWVLITGALILPWMFFLVPSNE
jgi:hypothetical protein